MFEKFFGKGSFSDELDIEALQRELPNRIEQVKETATTPQAMQVLRDLCIVARAEGSIEEPERALLDKIADGLDIARGFVCTTLDNNLEPD